MDFPHEPVLLQETIRALAPRSGGRYIDATVGGGGHASELLRASAPDGQLLAIDRDPAALAAAAERLRPFGARVRLWRGSFARLSHAVAEVAPDWLNPAVGPAGVDGVLFDLGVSSPQLDVAERGFSYRLDAPLDMRMDPALERSARDIVNEADPGELTRILREFGEERWAARIARFIVRARAQRPIHTTGELVDVIKAAIPAFARRQGPHPARRTFQALRIAVNDELGALRAGLRQAIGLTRAGGRIAAISFHSLEDRIVKEAFAEAARGCMCPPGQPVCTCGRIPAVRLPQRRPLAPDPAEIERNPRARSAKLRVAEKLTEATTGKEGDIP